MAWYGRPRRAPELIAYCRLRGGRLLSLFLPPGPGRAAEHTWPRQDHRGRGGCQGRHSAPSGVHAEQVTGAYLRRCEPTAQRQRPSRRQAPFRIDDGAHRRRQMRAFSWQGRDDSHAGWPTAWWSNPRHRATAGEGLTAADLRAVRRGRPARAGAAAIGTELTICPNSEPCCASFFAWAVGPSSL